MFLREFHGLASPDTLQTPSDQEDQNECARCIDQTAWFLNCFEVNDVFVRNNSLGQSQQHGWGLLLRDGFAGRLTGPSVSGGVKGVVAKPEAD